MSLWKLGQDVRNLGVLDLVAIVGAVPVLGREELLDGTHAGRILRARHVIMPCGWWEQGAG